MRSRDRLACNNLARQRAHYSYFDLIAEPTTCKPTTETHREASVCVSECMCVCVTVCNCV